MTTRDYVFRLRGDADQLAQAHERAAAAADQHAEQTAGLVRQQAAAKGSGDALASSLARQAAGMHAAGVAAAGFARSGKLSALELQQVGYQLNDLAVQVASGQNPLTALVQQGSQLSGTFGGIRPALAAVASLITPAVVGFGALALGVGAVGLAYAQGEREDRRFRDSLVLTGNAAGVTRDSFNATASAVQAASRVTIGAAREITQSLVETGQLGPVALAAVAQAAATLSRVSGKSGEDAVKSFAGIANGAAKWALETNKSFNFLTAETLRYIKTLEAQGKTEEAVRVATQAFTQALDGRTRQLGVLEQAWDSVSKAASNYKNIVVDILRADTTGDQVSRTAMALVDAQAQLARGDKRAAPLVQALQARFDALKAQQAREEQVAQESAAAAEKNRKGLLRQEEGYLTASAGLQRSGLALVQAQAAVERDKELAAVEEGYSRNVLSLAGYTRMRAKFEQQIIDDKRAAIDQDIALERERQIPDDKSVEGLQREGRITDLQARRVALMGEEIKLNQAKQKDFGKKDGNPFAELEGKIQDDLARRLQANDDRGREAREKAIEDAIRQAEDLRQTNRELGISLIADDERRGQAQIAFEAARLKKQIVLEQLAGEERKAAEDAVATYIALRNQQLTEQLKPEWQKQLEAWQDTTRLMREAHASFIGGFIQTGEQAWLKFIETGKLSLSSFGTLIRDELARLTYRQFIAPAVANIGKTIAGAIGIKLPGAAGGDAGQAAAKAAETAAVTNNTLALTAMQTTGLVPANSALVLLTGSANAAAAALAQVSGGQAASGLSGLIGSFFGAGGVGDGTGIGLPGVGDGGGMPFPFAKGAAFTHSMAPTRFAQGGAFSNRVISEPTPFRFARGGTPENGLMGEAGPEAVMPLTRTAGGKLGVAAVGGAGAPPVVQMHVEIINNHPQAKVRTQEQPGGGMRVLIEQIEGELGSRIDSGVGLARNIGGRFALNSGAGLAR